MDTLYIDLETFSERPIKHGAYQYAENSRVLIIAYAFNDDLVNIVDVSSGEKSFRKTMDTLSREIIHTVDRIIAHNSQFDRMVLKENGYDIDLGLWEDTMVRAYMHGLPGSLGELSAIYRLPVDKAKDRNGKALIRRFCMPQKDGEVIRPEDDPESWKKFLAYAGNDIEAMRILDKKLPRWNCFEFDLWRLDQKINGRGFKVDVDLAEGALKAVEDEKRALRKRTAEITQGELDSTTRRDATLKYILEAYGVPLPDLQISTIERRMQDPELPTEVKELLDIRCKVSLTSNRKYKALINGVNSDDRLRGTLQFDGAPRTGRSCIAEGSIVRVKREGKVSEVPIEDVLKTDLVWDGDNWVEHEGVVFSGVKEAIEYENIIATPEHIVYISTTEHVTLAEAKEKGLKLWGGN